MMLTAAPVEKTKKAELATLRWRMMRGGMVAFSLRRIWRTTKDIVSKAKSTRSRTIRQERQGYLAPPHWRTRRRQLMPTTVMPVLRRSSCRHFSWRERVDLLWSSRGW